MPTSHGHAKESGPAPFSLPHFHSVLSSIPLPIPALSYRSQPQATLPYANPPHHMSPHLLPYPLCFHTEDGEASPLRKKISQVPREVGVGQPGNKLNFPSCWKLSPFPVKQCWAWVPRPRHQNKHLRTHETYLPTFSRAQGPMLYVLGFDLESSEVCAAGYTFARCAKPMALTCCLL